MQKFSDIYCKIFSTLSAIEPKIIGDIASTADLSEKLVLESLSELIKNHAPIKKHENETYSLNYPVILLDKDQILKNISNDIDLSLWHTIDSTNDFLKKTALNNLNPHVCVAETQTQGKGQRNKYWHSPFAENIYLSIAIPFQGAIQRLSGLSLAIGIALASAIEKNQPSLKVKLKWPNDIILSEKKLAGILIEAKEEKIIIGMGVNVNMSHGKRITQAWTSLKQQTNTTINRNILCAQIINETLAVVNHFLESGLIDFMPLWHQKDYLYNQTISLTSNNQKQLGVAKGINEKGHLLVKDDNGEIISLASANDIRVIKET